MSGKTIRVWMIVHETAWLGFADEKSLTSVAAGIAARDVSYRGMKTRRFAPFGKTLRTSRRAGVNPAPTKAKAHRLKPACGRQACAT